MVHGSADVRDTTGDRMVHGFLLFANIAYRAVRMDGKGRLAPGVMKGSGVIPQRLFRETRVRLFPVSHGEPWVDIRIFTQNFRKTLPYINGL
jgi:hypothetical protein